jgi:predicted nuclease of predicted toxin-antitoxin system
LKILLDENMPESVRRELRRCGHEVDSVASLRLQGLDNGRLYREIAVRYDICFSKDREFVTSTAASSSVPSVKLIHVALPQLSGREFAKRFIEAFESTTWEDIESGLSWPAPSP